MRAANRKPSPAVDPSIFERIMEANSSGLHPALIGLGAGGMSVLGNAATGQLEEKGPGRIIAESIGAGLLGGGLGKLQRYNNELAKELIARGEMSRGKAGWAAANAAQLGGAVAVGGLGGLIGGGVSNAANLVGVPSFGTSNTQTALNSMQNVAKTSGPAGNTSMPLDQVAMYEAYLASDPTITGMPPSPYLYL